MIRLCIACTLVFTSVAVAQSIPKERPRARPPSALTGWADWEKGEALLKRIQVPPAPVRTPDEESRTFKLAPGYRIELVASEPAVQCPIFFEFDPDGRIWCIEYQGYMRDLKGSGEGDPICRLVVLEDADADGRAEKQTVYLDKLVMPRSFAFVKGGILLQEPPKLWFCEDTDGDLKCDRRREVGSMGVAGNPQHTANGLRYGLDNWLHCADWPKRYRWQDGRLVEAGTLHRGQFGVSFDDAGRFISCYENSAAHMDLIPAAYIQRNPALARLQQQGGRGALGINANIAKAAQEVFPIRPTPAVTLGALELREDGRLRTYTIVSGTCLYNGDQFPDDAYGNIFVPESGGHLVGRLKLPGGTEPQAARFYPAEQELLASTDERFRPVNARVGPDGCLYIADMYHGIIEHIIFMVPWLTKQIEERKLHEGNDLGRLWRIAHDGRPVNRKPPGLGKATTSELVAQLGHRNGWHRLTAQRLLVEAGDQSIAGELRRVITDGGNSIQKVHALWTLEGLGAVDHATVLAAIRSGDEPAACTAMRVSEPHLGEVAFAGVLREIGTRASASPSPARLQTILSLGAAPAELMKWLAALEHMALTSLEQAAVLSGCEGRELEVIASLLNKPARGASENLARAELLHLAASCAANSSREGTLAGLVELADQARPAEQKVLLGAMRAVFSKGSPAPKPVALRAAPKIMEALAATGDSDARSLEASLRKVFTWPGAAKSDPPSTRARALNEAEKKQLALGEQSFAVTCAACHQMHGEGVPGAFPPLAGSEWVAGDVERLARIVLHGLYGKIEVKGQPWNLVMPGLGSAGVLDDEKIAAALSYVRNSWGNEGSFVDAKLVAKVRAQYPDRYIPWTADELAGIAADTKHALIKPGADGVITLPAKAAATYGQRLAYRPSLDVLAPWTVADDSAEWRFEAAASGEHEVAVVLAADDESAGDQYILETENSKATGTVRSTGGYETHEAQPAGKLMLKAGPSRLLLRPLGPLKRELADVRAVVLRPRAADAR